MKNLYAGKCPKCGHNEYTILNPSMPTINQCTKCGHKWNPNNEGLEMKTLADEILELAAWIPQQHSVHVMGATNPTVKVSLKNKRVKGQKDPNPELPEPLKGKQRG